jgi:hypothetical protein
MAPTVAANVHAISRMHPLGPDLGHRVFGCRLDLRRQRERRLRGGGECPPWSPDLCCRILTLGLAQGQSRPWRQTLQTSREVMPRGCWAPHRPGRAAGKRPSSERTDIGDRPMTTQPDGPGTRRKELSGIPDNWFYPDFPVIPTRGPWGAGSPVFPGLRL